MLYNAKYSKNGGKNSNKYNKCFIVCKNVENIADALPELVESIEDIFLLTFENVQKIPSQFAKITEEHFGNFSCTLWKKMVISPQFRWTELKICSYENSIHLY